MKSRYYNTFYVLLLSIFCYGLNPVLTEHIEFGLSLSGIVEFSSLNKFFVERTTDLSSQVVIPSILLSWGINRFYLQLIFGYLIYALPFFALWEYTKKLKYPLYLFSLTFLLLLFFKIPNWYYYPINFPIDFFEFGNSGLWMFLLCVGLLINKNPIGFLLIGLLFSWHLAWFFAGCLIAYPLIKKTNISVNKLSIYSLLTGIILSLVFNKLGLDFSNRLGVTIEGLSFGDRLLSLMVPYQMVDGPFTGHNPILFKDQNIKHIFNFLFNILFPMVVINLRSPFSDIESIRNNLSRAFNILFIVTFFLLIYLELSRYYPLVLAGSLQRIIINRYFDAILIIGSLISMANVYYSIITKNLIKFNYIYLVIYILYIMYFFAFNLQQIVLISTLIALLILFNRFISYSLIPKKLLLVIPFLTVIFFMPRATYSAISYFKSTTDPVLNYLIDSSVQKDRRAFLLGWNVQSTSGMNVSLFSNSSYYVAGKLDYRYKGETKSVYCYDEFAKNYFDLIVNNDKCFAKRDDDEWIEIFRALNLKGVIVQKSALLNLKLVATNNLFNIYILPDVK